MKATEAMVDAFGWDLLLSRQAVRDSLNAALAAIPPLDVHAALNTYETVAADQGIYLTHAPDDRVTQAEVIGANHRRLIVRDTDEGLYVGGCVITDPAVARALAEVVADWARARLEAPHNGHYGVPPCGATTTATAQPCGLSSGHVGWHLATLQGGSTHEWPQHKGHHGVPTRADGCICPSEQAADQSPENCAITGCPVHDPYGASPERRSCPMCGTVTGLFPETHECRPGGTS